jgi:hypothetical protein
MAVGEGGEDGEHEGGQECGPDRPAHLGAHLADQRVDAGAEDVPDHEDGQEPGADRTSQRGGLLVHSGADGRGVHEGRVPQDAVRQTL